MNNAINWFDLPTVDFDRAVKFYSTILDVEIPIGEHMGQKLAFFPKAPDAVGGDIVPPGPHAPKPSPDGTRIYLNCQGKLDAVLARVAQAGGKILTPKFSIGDPG